MTIMREYFPLINWAISSIKYDNRGADLTVLAMMIVSIITAVLRVRRPFSPKREKALLVILLMIFISAEALYRIKSIGPQMLATFLGLPSLSVLLGFIIGRVARKNKHE